MVVVFIQPNCGGGIWENLLLFVIYQVSIFKLKSICGYFYSFQQTLSLLCGTLSFTDDSSSTVKT